MDYGRRAPKHMTAAEALQRIDDHAKGPSGRAVSEAQAAIVAPAVEAWFEKVNERLPEGVSIALGVNPPSLDDHMCQCSTCDMLRMGEQSPVIPNNVRELLVQADAAIEKSRGLLRRAVSALVRGARPSDIGVEDLLAEINDLLGD